MTKATLVAVPPACARSHEIMKLLAALNRDRGLTIVMVTHEPDMAAYAARTVRFLDGRIASDTRTPDVVEAVAS